MPAPPPLLRIEYTSTPAEFVEAALYPFRAQRLRNMLLSLVGSAFLIFALVIGSNRDPNWPLIIVLIIYPIVSLLNPLFARRALADFFRKHPILSETSIGTYSDEGVFVQTPSIDSFTRWHAFTHFTESPRLFFLHRGPGNPVYLAKRVFNSPAEIDAYRQLLTQHIGRTSLEQRHGFPIATPAVSQS